MYKLKVNDKYSFDLSDEKLKSLDVITQRSKQFHVIEDNISVHATLETSDYDKKTYTFKINNNRYTVVINDPLDQQIESLGFELGSAKTINNISAPMPGLILEVNVAEGQEVKEDDNLLILEAMKMENVITSPRPGTIKSVKINQGETVDKNTLLIEFE